MARLGDVLMRHMNPMLDMLTAAIRCCPAEAWRRAGRIAVQEHAYHCIYFMDRRFDSSPSSYQVPEIHDEAAATMRGPAAATLDVERVLGHLEGVRKKVAARLDAPDEELMAEGIVNGKAFSVVDSCLTHLRHVQHHVALMYRLIHEVEHVDLPWRSYLWG